MYGLAHSKMQTPNDNFSLQGCPGQGCLLQLLEGGLAGADAVAMKQRHLHCTSRHADC